MGENFVVISEWTFADTEGLLSLWEIEAKYFFLLCVHISGQGIFLLLFLSLWVNIKKTMLNELRLLLYAAEKYNERNGKLFFYF